MANTTNVQTHDQTKVRLNSPNLALIAWTALASIGLIIVVCALSASPGLDPDQVLQIFAVP
jgi:hypothetical protein